MSETFSDLLRKLKSQLHISATGKMTGDILTVTPRDDTPDAKAAFNKLLGILGGGLFATGIVLVFKSLLKASTSQVMGVTGAARLPGGSAGIGLFGYCLEARKKTPESDETFDVIDSQNIPNDQIVRFLEASEEFHGDFDDDYFFLEHFDKPKFVRDFNQAGIWILTDDIGFLRARDNIFPPFMFFAPAPMEVMLGLRQCLMKSVEGIQGSRYDKELIEVCRINHVLGFIPDDIYAEWQVRFGFGIA